MIPFLNVDAGESDEEPEELYRLAHAVNVACGGHAGDETSMKRVVSLCAAANTRVGAHPSYPDRENFGRTSVVLRSADLTKTIAEQCARLDALVDVTMVKAHGALYHDVGRDRALADAFLDGVLAGCRRAPSIVGAATGALREAARARSLPFLREGFADRGANPDGSLIARGSAGALITDPAAARATAERLARSGTFDTLCVHGDTPCAVDIARAVRSFLDSLV